MKHKAKELKKYSLYSISEFSKNKIHKYRIIGNPGCYPTSIQIPLFPLLINNLINTNNITHIYNTNINLYSLESN